MIQCLMISMTTIRRVHELKKGDKFFFYNTQYRVVAIKDGRMHYDHPISNHRYSLGQKSQQFIRVITESNN